MRIPVLLFRMRRWLRRRNLTLLVIVGLIAVAVGMLLLLAGRDGAAPEPDARVSLPETRPVDAGDTKIDARMEAAVAAEAQAVAGNDLASLPAFTLPLPLHSLDGTRFRRGNEVVQLFGVEGPKDEDVCLDGGGRRWSCGLQARAALHNAVAGQVLQCQPRKTLSAEALSASCTMFGPDGRQAGDLARLLVAQGWARPNADGQDLYGAEASAAQGRQAGLWRGGWTISPPSQ